MAIYLEDDNGAITCISPDRTLEEVTAIKLEELNIPVSTCVKDNLLTLNTPLPTTAKEVK